MTEHDDPVLSKIAEIEERRKNERSRIIVDLYYDGHGATGIASLQDISLGGLFMKTDGEIAVGSELHLRIPLGNEHIIAKAEVVYVNQGEGVGVKFIALSDNARTLLEEQLSNE